MSTVLGPNPAEPDLTPAHKALCTFGQQFLVDELLVLPVAGFRPINYTLEESQSSEETTGSRPDAQVLAKNGSLETKDDD
jgi:hypothetical protein